jgi:dTDP-4-dehydrorhamnose 3,5-epimerase
MIDGMIVRTTDLPDVLVLEPRVFGDARGYFLETFRAPRYQAAGIDAPFVQDNLSRSTRGVLRGLHLQNPRPQGKLVSVVEGRVWDVAVDLRVGSPHFGRWAGVELDAESHRQFWVPPGFGHGFVVLSETAVFTYKCTDIYDQSAELGVRWDDPDLAIDWPIEAARIRVSDKDAELPFLRDLPRERLVSYEHGD